MPLYLRLLDDNIIDEGLAKTRTKIYAFLYHLVSKGSDKKMDAKGAARYL